MTAKTKPKQIPKYDPNGEITAFQITRIRQLCGHSEKEKERWVRWVTNGASSSLKSLIQSQAILIIKELTGQEVPEPPKQVNENWAVFNPKNNQHRYILSLCIQYGWSVENNKYGEVANLERLSNWLKSDKSPIRKPLKDMSPNEVSKVIVALENMIEKHHGK